MVDPDSEPDLAAALGAHVRRRRQDAGMSMTDLASRVGVSQPFISRVENGRARPSLSTLTRLAAALGVAPGDLVGAGTPAPSAEVRVIPADGGLRVPVSTRRGSAVGRVIASGRDAGLEFVEYRVDPSEHLDDWFAFPGELVLYVVAGRLAVEVEGAGVWELGPQESMHHDASLRHRWRPIGDAPVHAVFAALRRGVAGEGDRPFAAR